MGLLCSVVNPKLRSILLPHAWEAVLQVRFGIALSVSLKPNDRQNGGESLRVLNPRGRRADIRPVLSSLREEARKAIHPEGARRLDRVLVATGPKMAARKST